MPRRKGLPHVPAPKPGYSFADLLLLTEATKNNLIHWTTLGITTGGIDETEGRGHHRRFSPLNVIEVQLAATINRHRVPATTIQGAINVFRHFHRQAVALHGQRNKTPLVTARSQFRIFRNVKHRREAALGYYRERTGVPPMSSPEQLAMKAHAIGEAWAYLRTGPLVRGIPHQSPWVHFLGLFLTDNSADVVLDPTPMELSDAVESSAIVVNLADVIWQVGQRCRRLGNRELGAW